MEILTITVRTTAVLFGAGKILDTENSRNQPTYDIGVSEKISEFILCKNRLMMKKMTH